MPPFPSPLRLGRNPLLDQVTCHHDLLDLGGAFVDLCNLSITKEQLYVILLYIPITPMYLNSFAGTLPRSSR